jgi:rhodanese-related sulfurtransferase
MTRLILFLFSLSLISCSQPQVSGTTIIENEFDKLLAYLEAQGDYINSSEMPSILNATAVYQQLDNNSLILDIRKKEDFENGHIRHAVNVEPASLLSYFEDVIEPSGFESIVLVCNTGVKSSYITALFRLLGYNNVFSLGFGLSVWDSDIADNNWLPALSSHLIDDLEQTPNEVQPCSGLPFIFTGEMMPYKILRARVKLLLEEDLDNVFVEPDELYANYNQYFIATFRPKNLYDHSHLKGSVHFAPRVALKREEHLFDIPAGKPVLLYCNRGHTSAFGIAFLRVLGYDAHSITFGTSSFMYDTMLELIPEVLIRRIAL